MGGGLGDGVQKGSSDKVQGVWVMGCRGIWVMAFRGVLGTRSWGGVWNMGFRGVWVMGDGGP